MPGKDQAHYLSDEMIASMQAGRAAADLAQLRQDNAEKYAAADRHAEASAITAARQAEVELAGGNPE